MNQTHPYCHSLFEYRRNETIAVPVGEIGIGGDNPIRIQSMTTTNTLDTEASVEQCISIIEAGGELVRLTTQGRREAANLKNIKETLRQKGYNTPLSADIHFNPNAAEIAASLVEKVRINPGNFVGGAKKFDLEAYSDADDSYAMAEIKEKLLPLLAICKKHNTALRIGVNHGSLSDRIMARYGDTPEGMVASCMEYLRICCEDDFHNIVISIKSSNTRVMVHTVRLLAATMRHEKMAYPLHLGVTEAGSEEEGRIKSAVGTGALLADGLGDTIRVSLTEEPCLEIPVAQKLVRHIARRSGHQPINPADSSSFQPYEYHKRKTHQILNIGGNMLPVVIAPGSTKPEPVGKLQPDYRIVQNSSNSTQVQCTLTGTTYPLLTKEEIGQLSETPSFVELNYNDLDESTIAKLKSLKQVIIIAESHHINAPAELRAFILTLAQHQITNPIVVALAYDTTDMELFQIAAAADAGLLFLDGLADGILLNNKNIPLQRIIDTQFGILQASRVRFSQTDFISCPGCGRTLFDLRETTRIIKARTSHLKGLKIGIMGCIVNGIGEMADADYGYVGSGPQRVSLFKNRELVAKNLPEQEAVEALIELIKQHGDWVEPPTAV